MNNQLIEKVIKSSSETCPSFSYENPILDPNIAKSLSKSFVKILKLSNENTNINSNLRTSVLENIRKMCVIEPEDHMKINDNLSELLTETYRKNIEETISKSANNTDKMLDAFLVRKLNAGNIESSYKSALNPEVIQALINLSENGPYVEILSKEIIHWQTSSNKCKSVLKDLWTNNKFKDSMSKSSLDDISLKMKPEIEMILLENCCKVLENKDVDMEELLTSEANLLHLVKTSAISSICFQISYNILNYLFKMINFDAQILSFTTTFVSYVKLHSLSASFSTLYPSRLSNVVLLLDIDLNELPEFLKNYYIKMSKLYLKELHETSENDLIIVLTHFPEWFDIYFSN